MKNVICLWLIVFFSLSLHAQFNSLKSKLLEKTQQALDDDLAGKLGNSLSKSKQEYDQANFHYALSLADHGELFESKEKFDRQKTVLLGALRSIQDQPMTPMQKAEQYNDGGEIFYANAKYTSAQKSFDQAQKTLEQEKQTNLALYATVIANQALLDHTQGKLAEAIKEARQALALRQAMTDGDPQAAQAASLNNIGVLLKELGEWNFAEDTLLLAQEKSKAAKGEGSLPYAIASNNVGMLYITLGRYAEAEPIFKQALEAAYKDGGKKSDLALRLSTNLAVLYQATKRYAEAEKIYVDAMKVKENRLGTGHPDYAHFQRNLASIYAIQGKYSEAENLLKKADQVYIQKLGELHPAHASLLEDLGLLYRKTGKFDAALESLEKARSIREKVLGVQHPDYAQTLLFLAQTQQSKGAWKEAGDLFSTCLELTQGHTQKFFAPMSENEKANYWDKVSLRYEAFYEYAFFHPNPSAALWDQVWAYRMATRGILMSSDKQIKSSIAKSKDPILIQKYQQWVQGKMYLSKVYSFSKQQIQEENIQIDSLEKVLNGLEKFISAKTLGLGVSSSATNMPALKPQEAAIELFKVRYHTQSSPDPVFYAALISSPQGKKSVVWSKGSELDGKYFKYYRNCIHQKIKDEKSHEIFWQPIEKQLGKATQLYLCTDGVFSQINLNTLKANGSPQETSKETPKEITKEITKETPKEIKYVLDQYQISYLTHLKDLAKAQSKEVYKPTSIVLVGNPAYGTSGTLAPLPGTLQEIQQIKKLFVAQNLSVKLYAGDQASEAQVKNLSSMPVVHLATHGYFAPDKENDAESLVFGISSDFAHDNPLLRSGLLFAQAEKGLAGNIAKGQENGILTAYEALDLNMNKTKVMVLSACETGLGDVKAGEGVYGLQRALRMSGVGSLVMSLWTVNDDATQALMTQFYSSWLQTGQMASSFRNAQISVRKKYSDPYFWGAFIWVQ